MCLSPRSNMAAAITGIGGVDDPCSMYSKILHLSEDGGEFFTTFDIVSRVMRCWLAHYWMMVRFPLSYGYFLIRYNMLWEGPLVGALLTVCGYPLFYPLAALALVLGKRIFGLDGGYVTASEAMEPPSPPARSSPRPPRSSRALAPVPARRSRPRPTSSSSHQSRRWVRCCGTTTRRSLRRWRSS